MRAMNGPLTRTRLLLVVSFAAAALATTGCKGDKQGGSGSSSASGGAGGICGDRSAERCMDGAISMFEADKDAANAIAEYLCKGEFGKTTREACTISGHVYRMGAPQTKKDPKVAIERYERGCPIDDPDAQHGSCFRLGLLYGKGVLTLTDKPSYPIDKDKGKKYLDLACKKGFAEACTVSSTL